MRTFILLRPFQPLPQPIDRNTLFVVHSKLVDTAIDELRALYAKRSKSDPKDIVKPFAGDVEEREVLMEWFDTEIHKPKVLVSSPAIVKEALHLNLQHLVIGTKVTADALFHLIGRLAHGECSGRRNDRLLVTQQQFSDSNLKSTPFVTLNHEQEFPEEGFQWIPGHILMSDTGFQSDQRRTKNKERQYGAIKVPSTKGGKNTSPIKTAHGIMLIQKGAQYATPSATRRVPMKQAAHYSPKDGPPSREVVLEWAQACGGEHYLHTYHSVVNLIAQEAYSKGENPRKAVEEKVSKLRERSAELNNHNP